MPSLSRRGNRWQIRWYDARRRPTRAYTSLAVRDYPKRRDAEKHMHYLDGLLQRGQFDPWTERKPGQVKEEAERLSVMDAVKRYCKYKRRLGKRRQRGGWSERTYKNYLPTLKDFAARTGKRRLIADLQTEDLERFIYQERLAEATQEMYHRMLRTFVSWLEKEKLATLTMPPQMVTRRRIRDYVTEDELCTICTKHLELLKERSEKKHVPKSGSQNPLVARAWMTDAWRLCFYQCLRRGELLSLRRQDVDLKRRTLRIGHEQFDPKDRRDTVVPITPPALPIIEKYCQGLRPGQRLFDFNSPGRLTKEFGKAAAAVVPEKADDLDVHALRRSGGYFWAERGVSLLDLKHLMRHKSVTTTEKYYVQTAARGIGDRFDAAYVANL